MGLVALVLLLWLLYVALQTLTTVGCLTEEIYAIVGFLPGFLAVSALRAGGFRREELFLRLAPVSGLGLAVLTGIFVFALVAILPFGVWKGWHWQAALVLAPASGISQELFFRSALFPLFLRILPGRPLLALTMHSALFGLWHIGPLFIGAPVGAVLAIMVVPFLCGLGWGWAVRRDRTVVWAMVQHSLIWVIGNQFTFSA
jgi:membrane protease YdiL (CAAX protease family)